MASDATKSHKFQQLFSIKILTKLSYCCGYNNFDTLCHCSSAAPLTGSSAALLLHTVTRREDKQKVQATRLMQVYSFKIIVIVVLFTYRAPDSLRS